VEVGGDKVAEDLPVVVPEAPQGDLKGSLSLLK